MKMVCAPTAQKRGLCGLLSDDDVKEVFFSFSFLFSTAVHSLDVWHSRSWIERGFFSLTFLGILYMYIHGLDSRHERGWGNIRWMELPLCLSNKF